jgi:hypothetical protein
MRRALTTAGGILGWSETSVSDAGPVAEVSHDVLSLTTIGVDSLSSDLAEERAQKQTETSRLSEAAAYTRRLAADPHATYPVEITYSYTTRDPFGAFVTRSATIKVTNEGEALGTAESLDRSIESRSKLADLMVLDLAERRGRLQAVARGLQDFARSSRWLLADVIASLD